MRSRMYFRKKMTEYGVPEHMRGDVEAYLFDHITPGGFLQAVFENNLMEALGRADASNQRALPAYGMILFNEFPMGAYGSPAAVEEWLNPDEAA